MKYTYFIIFSLIIVSGIIIYNLKLPNLKDKTITAALDKEVSFAPLMIEGTVPAWLNGSFVRNGPVSVQINDQKLSHWFDGPAMLHAFAFENGKVKYTNKFLRSEAYEYIFTEGKLNFSGFGSVSSNSLWKIVKTLFSKDSKLPIQNANVNVAQIASQYVALTETPLPVRFDIKTLDTLGNLIFQDDLPKKNAFESAHIQYDQKTQEQINYLVEYGRKSYYVVYRLNKNKPIRELIGKVPVEKPAYMHSFALTQHYVVLVEFPLRVNPIDLMLGRKSFIKSFVWDPKQGTNFIIIDRKTGEVVKTINDKKSVFAFHHVNAYEQDSNIVLDIVTYPDASVISDIADNGDFEEPSNLKNRIKNPQLVRYTISLLDNSVHEKPLLEAPIEFPRINEALNAYPYRYIYAIDPRPLKLANDLRPIYKIDTTTGMKIIWQEAGSLPGEPIFIANPTLKGEDEGVVISIVIDPNKQKTYLLVLDGKSFTELGRIYAPHLIPAGFHGQFFKNIPEKD